MWDILAQSRIHAATWITDDLSGLSFPSSDIGASHRELLLPKSSLLKVVPCPRIQKFPGTMAEILVLVCPELDNSKEKGIL